MSDIHIRKSGKAGRITLTRLDALNALSYDMCLAIEEAIEVWRDDPEVALVVLDAEGDRAFCSGGDVAQIYSHGIAGDYTYGQTFWRDEYRLNAKIAQYTKPIVSLLQGFTMGGGVGLGCHASHRVVGPSSQIAMPECGIGLVPDVGGTWILARAPGRCGEFLGITGTRMGPADAIYAGFADYHIDTAAWPALISELELTGDVQVIMDANSTPEVGTLSQLQGQIDTLFAPGSLEDIRIRLVAVSDGFTAQVGKPLSRNSPLSMTATLELVRMARSSPDVVGALANEFRYTFRALEHGDFLEGVRAQIIDRDRAPKWRDPVGSAPDPAHMLAPLGDNALQIFGERP